LDQYKTILENWSSFLESPDYSQNQNENFSKMEAASLKRLFSIETSLNSFSAPGDLDTDRFTAFNQLQLQQKNFFTRIRRTMDRIEKEQKSLIPTPPASIYSRSSATPSLIDIRT